MHYGYGTLTEVFRRNGEDHYTGLSQSNLCHQSSSTEGIKPALNTESIANCPLVWNTGAQDLSVDGLLDQF